MTDKWVLFSGGHDSLVATHFSMEKGLAEAVLHIDTGTGLPQNQDFVEDFCRGRGYPLTVESSSYSLKELAVEFGFPSPATHTWTYRYLKERPLREVAKRSDGKPHFYTGVRRQESERRFRNVEDGRETDRFVWYAPIASFSKRDVEAYIDDHDLPRNPVVENIHRSGECFCGAFAARDEELIDLEAHYPRHYNYLLEVEERVQSEIGTSEDYCFWGHGEADPRSLRAEKAEKDDQQLVLCRGCQPAYPTEDSEEVPK